MKGKKYDWCCWAHCPECEKWVPAASMNHFDGIRVCDWCLNQEQDKPPHDRFAYQPLGKERCIFCDSYNTDKIEGSSPQKYKCNECGEEFVI